MMTVKELIQELQQVSDPDRVVVMSIDPEGNGFQPLDSFSEDAYLDGEVGLEQLTQEAKDQGYGEADVLHGGAPAICLWPR